MPTYSLVPHPERTASQVRDVSAALRRTDHHLALTFRVLSPEHVAWPDPAPPRRTDELWLTTCFELFLQFDDGERYVEFNFSPSTRWAAYAFDGYRDGIKPLDPAAAPAIERRPDGIAVSLTLAMLPRGEHRMGLSAVIEEIDGTNSYWALAHAPGPPDFHDPACFIATLPAPERP